MLQLLLVVGGALAVLSTVEIGLRVAGARPFPEALREFAAQIDGAVQPSSNPDRHYELTPNAELRCWGTDVKVNPYGFRGPDLSENKRAGSHRIALLGDSITFGHYVPEEASFPRLLEDLLRKDDIDADVLNLGVHGYDTIAAVATLEDVGLRFDVDTVIYTFCVNDLAIHSAELFYFEHLRRSLKKPIVSSLGDLRVIQLVYLNQMLLATRWNRWTSDDEEYRKHKRNNVLSIADDQGLEQRMGALEQELSALDPDDPMFFTARGKTVEYSFLETFTSETRIGHFEAALLSLQELKDEHQLNVAINIVPFLNNETYELWQLAYEIVQYEVTKYGFDLIPMVERLHAIGLDELRMTPLGSDHLHPSPLGHRVIAQLLADYVKGAIDADPPNVQSANAEEAR
jgi:lysophospholipase L1-like esterase